MKFRPCIDLHNGKVKQIVGSTLSDDADEALVTNFETDRSAAWFASLYRNDALAGGHVIMLGPGNTSAAIEALEAFPGGLQLGGGITTENAAQFLASGASRIIVTSYVFNRGRVDWDRLKELSSAVGKERLVIDLSCRKRDSSYYVVTDRWQKFTSVDICSETLSRFAEFCDEFLVHAADIEGKQLGVDEELIGLLAQNSTLPVTYAGGIRSIDDLETVRVCGNNRLDATVGSALDIFGGSLKYEDVVAWHRAQQQ